MPVLLWTALAIIAFFFGAAVFSFLNVVAYRLPKHLDYVRGRSACPACGHPLSALDMIPVLGYVFRGGKCRYCGDRISARYPLVELLGGGLCILSFWMFRANVFYAFVCFAFVSVLFVVAAVDAETMEIPNGFVVAMAVVAVISYFADPSVGLVARLIGIVSVSLPMFLITLLVPTAFGGGDIKLMAAVGAFLGWKMNLVGFAVAVLLGGGYGIYLLLAKKADRKSHFAFGPYLCVGAAVAVFAGEPVLNWYLGFFH